ncbi:MAG: ABC transporter substrate-binding protein, partial [Paenibacillaceae bacterium]|nr:ABC transporter substrate-binding protein [Paenibacillaceae bacterium]
EVKTALGKLQELFKAGAINPEFSVIDGAKSGELATQGKVGMSFGQWWVGTWPIADMKKTDPKVEWQAYPLVSADGKPVKGLSTSALPTKFYVINKNAKNPEAVFKLLNYFNEKVYGKTPDETYHQVVKDGTTYQVFSYAPIVGTPTETNQNDYEAIQAALQSNDATKLTPAANTYYTAIQKYKTGDFGNFVWWSTFGPSGAFGILGNYKKNNLVVESGYTAPPTETMVSKGPTLRDLEAKAFTKIIMGDPLDSFDDFVKQWKQQGGDQILKEVAESGKFN